MSDKAKTIFSHPAMPKMPVAVCIPNDSNESNKYHLSHVNTKASNSSTAVKGAAWKNQNCLQYSP